MRDMWRGGGVCVSGLADSSAAKVSPRIRDLQDRLLGSLPADGAWECLSPPQREAIISIHRSRMNRTPDGLCTLPNDAKWKNKKYKEFSQYGRSRSFEDKLESETDDSGVRLASGGTSTSNSQEDDSSDPGVKKSGRFTKSQTADRFIRKEPKSFYDPKKKKTNGIGNVNKILSKQLAKSPTSNKVTLDCRNLSTERNRYRIDKNNPFDGPASRQGRTDLISRKNILQRHNEPSPRPFSREPKYSISSEEYDSGIAIRTDLSSFDDRFADNSFESSNFGNITSQPANVKYRKYPSEFKKLHPQTPCKYIDNTHEEYMKYQHETNNNLMWKDNRDCLASKSKNEPIKTVNIKNLCDSKLNFIDYRNRLNQDCNKYSSNWNNIVLSEDIPIKQTPLNALETRPSRISHGNPTNVSNNKNLDHKYVAHVNHEKFSGKRYIRSKSLDRKYLDESSDDDDDFDRRRKVERMKRYAKANADWDIRRSGDSRQLWPPKEDSLGRKSKSAWDLNKSPNNDRFDELDNGFRSRKVILSKWKSDDIDLAISSRSARFNQKNEAFSRNRWQRRSCDVELDCSDFEKNNQNYDINRRKLNRRSCDLELERDALSSEKPNLNISNDNDILPRRNAMRNRITSGYHGNRPDNNRPFAPKIDNNLPNGYKISRYDNCNRRMYQPVENKTSAYSSENKNKSRGGLRGKLRIFKSILSL